jgi:hypothetical protein
MPAILPHSGSARFAASLHLVTKHLVWNAAGPSKQLRLPEEYKIYAQASHPFSRDGAMMYLFLTGQNRHGTSTTCPVISLTTTN